MFFCVRVFLSVFMVLVGWSLSGEDASQETTCCLDHGATTDKNIIVIYL